MAGDSIERTTFADLIDEGLLEIGDGYRAKNEELGGDGLIFLRAGHVTDTHIDFNGVDRFHRELDARVRPKLARPGDAVVTTKGNSTGRTTYVSPSMPPFVYSPHLSYWRSRNRNRIEGAFLRYWSKGPEFADQLAGMKASTDMAPYLSLIDQKRLKITLPPIEHQRAIADILGTLDDKIELNRRMSETLEAMARALFKSWFLDFDPVRAKIEGHDSGLPKHIADLFPARLVDSKLGEIPEGWKVKPLDQVAHFQNGLALQKYRPKPDEERLPVVKIAQLRSGKAGSGEWATADLKPECIIDDGDVVFSWSGSLLVRVWCGGRAALNQHLFKVTSEEYPRWFFLDAILSHLPEFQRIAAGKATTMGHIQRRHLTDAKCVVPTANLLAATGPLFSGLVERGIANDVQNRHLIDLRDRLLPKLIAGDLRIGQESRLLGSA